MAEPHIQYAKTKDGVSYLGANAFTRLKRQLLDEGP
jgi:hypothetical protein